MNDSAIKHPHLRAGKDVEVFPGTLRRRPHSSACRTEQISQSIKLILMNLLIQLTSISVKADWTNTSPLTTEAGEFSLEVLNPPDLTALQLSPTGLRLYLDSSRHCWSPPARSGDNTATINKKTATSALNMRHWTQGKTGGDEPSRL